MKMAIHSPARFGLVITSVFVFALTLAFVFMSGMGPRSPGGMFTRDMNETSSHFFLEITPASWTFSIWGLIYTWQALWIIYSLVTLCRKTEEGYLYITPDVWHPAVFVGFMVSNLASVAWSFFFDRLMVVPSCVAIAMMPLSLYVSIAFSTRKMADNTMAYIKQGLSKDIWLVRILVHNGLGIYAAWVSIATLLNLAMVIAYVGKIEQDIACTVVLTVLGLELLFWVFLDMFFLDKWVRYLFTPYFVVVFALVGSMVKNWDATKRNSIFTAVLLGLAVLFLVAKMAAMFWRHCRRPLSKPEVEKVVLPWIS